MSAMELLAVLRPGDRAVVRVPDHLSEDEFHQIAAIFAEHTPERAQVLIVNGGGWEVFPMDLARITWPGHEAGYPFPPPDFAPGQVMDWAE